MNIFSINLTLIIQIFHFIVAYLLLKHLLLKDAIDVLHIKEQEVTKLNKEIENQNIIISEKKAIITDLWIAARKKFTEFFVLIIPSWISAKRVPTIKVKSLNDEKKEELKYRLKEQFIKKVKNV